MGSPDNDGGPFANHASSALPEPSSKRKAIATSTRTKWQQYASSLYGDYHPSSSENGSLQVPWRISSASARKKVKRRNSDWSRPNRRRRWQRDLGISDKDSWDTGTFRFLNTSNSTNEPTAMATSQSPGTTLPPTATAPATPHHNLDLILDVVFIFLSGLAIIVGLIGVVYALVILCDRYCRCAPRWAEWTDEMFSEWEAELGGNDNSTEEEDIAAATEAYGPIALKARLWGLTLKERRVVLEQVFAEHCRKYTLSTKESLNKIASATDCSNLMKDDINPTKPPDLTYSNSSISEPSTTEERSVPTTHVETSSTTSDSTYMQLSVDLEGGSSERAVPRRRRPSVDGDDDSSTQIPAQIRGKRPSSKEECSDDTVSELGAEADVHAADHPKETCLKRLLCFDESRVAASCAICLVEYSEGDKVLHGNHCAHIFHSDCIMAWMEDCHDHCPYCRVEMMAPEDMRRAATKVLSKERLKELTVGPPRKRRRQRRASAAESPTSESRPSDANFDTVGNDNGASETHPHLPPLPSSEEIEVVSNESVLNWEMGRVIEPSFARRVSRLGEHTRGQSSNGELVNPFHW